ncbi:AMP-binding protein [Streptomyces scopuliridis]|uniref:AMP-binding protein n=1 Tax=Streptomyces scopuliridis TaxID=452529 RepID=UPI0036A8041A
MRTPDGVAVTDERITLTYRELWERIEDMATVLAARGVTPGTAVAVVADRSTALVAALLGITRAGGASLPVDPEWPEARIRHVGAEAEPVLVLSDERYAALIDRCFPVPAAPLDGGEAPTGTAPDPVRPAPPST